MVAGYVIHPMVLPGLQEKGYVAKTTEEVDTKKSDGGDKPEDNADKPPVKPDVVKEEDKMPEPVTPDPVTPDPVTPDLTPKNAELVDAEFYKIIRSSVTSGQVSEFKVNQVIDWKRLGKKTIDGVEYDEGVATYKAKTIFGEQNLEAKVLVKDGKVEKWLWGATDTEMK